MEELTVSEMFGMIALKNQRSKQFTNAKKVALRAIASACLLELLIEGKLKEAKIQELLQNPNEYKDSYMSDILSIFPKNVFKTDNRIDESLKSTTGLAAKKLRKIEESVVNHLWKKGLLEEKNSVLSCDLEFESAGIQVKEYVVNDRLYESIVEEFRAEVLEPGKMTEEAIVLLWLCKESASLYELFSKREMETVAERFDELATRDAFAEAFYDITIHRTKEHMVKRFLNIKSDAIATPIGSGLNFIFPLIERSQAVFIDTEAYFEGAEARFRQIKDRLKKYHIDYEVVHGGDVPLLKIAGVLYEAVPYSKVYRTPVHGIQLRKYPVGA